MKDRLSRAEYALGALLSITAISFHCLNALSAGALWRDEANTVALATLPAIRDVWNNLQYDSFPAGWVLFVRSLAGLAGTMNDSAFRLAGLIIGLILLAGLWVNARAFNYRVPVISLALFALNPSVIHWGDSLRAYGGGMALAIFIGITIWKFVEQPGAKRFLFAALSAVAGVQILYYNAPVVFSFCTAGFVIAVMERRYRLACGVLIIGLLAALSLVAYVPVISGAATWNPLVTIPDYDLSWFSHKLGEAIAPVGRWGRPAWMFVTLGAVWLFVRQIALKPVDLSDLDRSKIAFAITALVTIAVSHFVFLRTLSYLTQPWYYLTLLAVVSVTVDVLAAKLMVSSRMRIARLGVALVIGVAAIAPAIVYTKMRMTNLDVVAAKVTEESHADDMVLIVPWYTGVSFARYYRGAAPFLTVPDIPFHTFHRYDLIAAEMQRADQPATLRPVLEQMRSKLARGNTIFLISDGPIWNQREPQTLLPAAVIERDGWKSPQYHRQWSAIVGSEVRKHAGSISPVPIDTGNPVSGYEHAYLTVIRGWHD